MHIAGDVGFVKMDKLLSKVLAYPKRVNVPILLGALIAPLALASFVASAVQAIEPSIQQSLTKPTFPPATPVSAPKESEESNQLVGLAKSLGIPAGAIAVFWAGWIIFTRGKSIQENQKAWRELLYNKGENASINKSEQARGTNNTTVTDLKPGRDVNIYQTIYQQPHSLGPTHDPTPLSRQEKDESISKQCSLPLASNPFGDRGRIRDPHRFFDRTELLRQIFDELRKGNSLSLVGETQIGKSSILEKIRQLGPFELDLPAENVIDIDMQVVHNENDFFNALCYKLEIARTLRGHALDRALRGKRYVLCIDEIEKMANLHSFSGQERIELRGLADGAEAPLTLLIASRSNLDSLFEDDPRLTSPLSGLCGAPIRVPPFTFETTREFLTERLQGGPIQFSPEEIEELWGSTKGHPAKLQAAAAELYRRLSCP